MHTRRTRILHTKQVLKISTGANIICVSAAFIVKRQLKLSMRNMMTIIGEVGPELGAEWFKALPVIARSPSPLPG